MQTEKKDLTKFEVMSETDQGALIGGFSAAVTASASLKTGTNNCTCTNNCKCVEVPVEVPVD